MTRKPLFRNLLGILFFLILTPASFSQVLDPFIQQIVSQVSGDTILANLQKFESLGKKEPGTAAIDNTANWLESKYASFGYPSISRDTFNYNGHQLYNLVVTKYGSLFPPKFLIVDGHYDTYNGPGVNDNGSGVSVILEIARLIKDLPTEWSIRFIHFSGEEEGLLGSQHYVDETVVPGNMNIGLVLNIDEVGGVAGTINSTVTCERDEASPTANNAASYAYTDTLVTLTHLYSALQTQIYYAYGSDYVPFQEAGEVITGLYETNESPYVHSPNDVLARMSPGYVTEITRAALGATLHFSKAHPLETSVSENPLQDTIRLFPNPARSWIRWDIKTSSPYKVRIINQEGKVVLEHEYNQSDEPIAYLKSLPNGLYAVCFINENNCSGLLTFVKSE